MNPQVPKTLFDKIWDQHVVHHEPGMQAIIYIDLHLVHEIVVVAAKVHVVRVVVHHGHAVYVHLWGNGFG